MAKRSSQHTRVSTAHRAASRTTRRQASARRAPAVRTPAAAELAALRRELERAARRPPRWNADPEDVQRSLAQLVLTLVEFLRRLMERQAIRRFDAGTLSEREAEDVGRALMELEKAVHDMAERFGLDPSDLNLDLGPIGTLL